MVLLSRALPLADDGLLVAAEDQLVHIRAPDLALDHTANTSFSDFSYIIAPQRLVFKVCLCVLHKFFVNKLLRMTVSLSTCQDLHVVLY